MTNEEALKGFEDYCYKCTEHCLQAGATLACCHCKVNIAKISIQKQIPKKMVKRFYTYYHGESDEPAWFCPTCGGFLMLVGYTALISQGDYQACQHCGQILDVSDFSHYKKE